ncbi:MAG: endonuclease MutS2, partial [Cyanobacteria bacterium]|nr:endonuclease MutS2 [Cyanobacteriota bacterium]
ETEEAVAVVTQRQELLVDRIPDLRETLLSLGAGAALLPSEILAIKQMLTIARRLKSSLELLVEASFPALRAYLPGLHVLDKLRREIERCLDERGEIKDDASTHLKHLRSSVRKLHNDIREELGRLMHSSTVSKALQESIYTTRHGRYVLPVDASKRSAVNGIVHDSSQSGLTVYVEPISVVEPTNKIRLKDTEIERECQRIIAELCAQIRESLRELDESFETLTTFDVIMARSRLSLKFNGIKPDFAVSEKLHLIDSSHPLLLLQGERHVVSNTVKLGGDDRTLVITGPNTGGKTVLLKQIGLMALMVRAGILIPAKPGSVMPMFRKVWADIGDEQSLEQSLSTFSSHMQNIVEIVRDVSSGTLILLDEIGVGTDPREGAAIARAVLEHLNRSGAVTVSTTHYGELKMLAYSEVGFVNGSLEFDQVNLAPTYKLRIGVAGSSKATTIAERLGLDARVIERSRELLEGGEKELAEAIAELENRLMTVAATEERLGIKEKTLNERETFVESEKHKTMMEQEAVREKFAHSIESQFNDARQKIQELTREMQREPSLRKASLAAERLKKLREELGWSQKRANRDKVEQIKVGDRVRVMSLNQLGTVEDMPQSELSSNKLVSVLCGIMKVKVSLGDLRLVEKAGVAEKARKRRTTQAATVSHRKEQTGDPSAFIRTSGNTVDLRGQRVDAALDMLDSFLDGCAVAGTSPVMIIHGHGTGAVKKAVRQYLTTCRYSRQFRPGELYEGGDGVTIADLK